MNRYNMFWQIKITILTDFYQTAINSIRLVYEGNKQNGGKVARILENPFWKNVFELIFYNVVTCLSLSRAFVCVPCPNGFFCPIICSWYTSRFCGACLLNVYQQYGIYIVRCYRIRDRSLNGGSRPWIKRVNKSGFSCICTYRRTSLLLQYINNVFFQIRRQGEGIPSNLRLFITGNWGLLTSSVTAPINIVRGHTCFRLWVT